MASSAGGCRGPTAILAEVEEYATEVLDDVVAPLGGQVLRLEAAAIAADREAARVLREKFRRKK